MNTFEEILKESGWTDSRTIDISEYEQELLTENYQLFPSAINFLKSFGGLELLHPAYKVRTELSKTHFNAKRASSHIYREKVETYEERVNESLVVVGEAFNEYLILMISNSGKMFGAVDDYLALIGDDFLDSVKAIVEGEKFKEIT